MNQVASQGPRAPLFLMIQDLHQANSCVVYGQKDAKEWLYVQMKLASRSPIDCTESSLASVSQEMR